VPNADDRKFFYGANFEFSINAKRWDPSRFTSKCGRSSAALEAVDIIFNPIVDTGVRRLQNLDFAPSVRVAYNVSDLWAVAAEEYADYGPLHHFANRHDQSHQIYGVVDYNGKLTWKPGSDFV